MAKQHHTGKLGESLALDYLAKNGFFILHKNWRYSHYEVDIIAHKENCLHIIEVKARTNDKFGYPEEAVTKKKFENLQKASEKFQELFPEWSKVQFDILSIRLKKNAAPEFFFIEDFYLY